MSERDAGSVEESLPVSTVFGVLSDARRRVLLRYLLERDRGAAVATIAKHVAATEHDGPGSAAPDDAIDRAHVSLYHHHLPKLEDGGLVEYDRDRNLVTLTEQARSVTPLVESDVAERGGTAREGPGAHRSQTE